MIPEQVSPPLNNDVELAGYRACAREAVLYLLNVEKIPVTDPMVKGLSEHLHRRQAHVEHQRLLDSIKKSVHNNATRSELLIAAYKGCDLRYSTNSNVNHPKV
ncbi:hypothetical protein C0J52_28456 [Blattella germanica]|nr:hypothetical protein C0J52_28456 [Blattella germanica]